MTRRSDRTSPTRRSHGFISTRACLVILLAVHSATVIALLAYANGASVTAAAIAAGQAFPAAFQIADRVVSPCCH